MPIDYVRITTFIEARPARKALASVLRRAALNIVWTEEASPERWGFHLKLDRTQRQLFGTSREVLIWVTEYPDFEARDVMVPHQVILNSRPRLCEDFAITITGDPNTRAAVRETSEQTPTHMIGLSLKDLLQFPPYGNADFVRFLQSELFTKDLYWVSTAITSNADFFGRKALLAEMADKLKSGQSNIGLFGLRRMGKTSLLLQLRERLRASRAVLLAHLDIQCLDAVNPSGEYFLWSLGESLLDGNQDLRRSPDLRLFGRYRTLGDFDQTSSVWEVFDHDLRHILRTTAHKLVFFFDEIELMSPDTPGSEWKNTFIRVWRLLKGLQQQHPGRLSYFVTGTNPHCTETNKLGGIENPAYNYFSKRYLPPLSQSEAQALLCDLGAKMGLNWTDDAIAAVLRHVGGHPFLLRAYGSRVHRALCPRLETAEITAVRINQLLSNVYADVNSFLGQMLEVLRDQYKNEYYLLETLARGRVNEFREMARNFPDDTAHLHGYGLIEEPGAAHGLAIEVLQTWLQRRREETDRISQDGAKPSSQFDSGQKFEGFTVVSAVGNPGGFARVYRAKDTDKNQEVAIKVFHGVSLASLEREVDVLKRVDHPNIVRIVDHGKAVTGHVYLVMEYLDGRTLAEYCDRANRLEPESAETILRSLLSALVALHPDDESIARLRRNPDLSAQEFTELGRARHGYVHRDIKPENVILVKERGAVLIDFNIAVRAAMPITTMSSTPGYLPPDGIGLGWTPDVDLFQLGLTMLQVAVGVPYDGSNLADLRMIAKESLPHRLANPLLVLSAIERNGRYASARSALRAMGTPV